MITIEERPHDRRYDGGVDATKPIDRLTALAV
jgi:hypothetical protein